jgi:hypothetical protein
MPLDILFWNSTGLDQAKLTAGLTIAINHNIDLVVLQEASSAASGVRRRTDILSPRTTKRASAGLQLRNIMPSIIEGS